VRTFTPLLGAELVLEPGARLSLDVDPAFEHGVLVDVGAVELSGTALARGTLGYLGQGATTLHLANPTDAAARIVLLGGEPLGENLVMWWNFVGRTHEEIAHYRDQWQAESERFGRVDGYPGARLPAPPLPTGRLRPRGNPPQA
jgi:quercetin 2,3-dioxygenase